MNEFSSSPSSCPKCGAHIHDAITAGTEKLADAPPTTVRDVRCTGRPSVLLLLAAIAATVGLSLLLVNATTNLSVGAFLAKLLPFASIAFSFVVIALVIRGRCDRKRE